MENVNNNSVSNKNTEADSNENCSHPSILCDGAGNLYWPSLLKFCKEAGLRVIGMHSSRWAAGLYIADKSFMITDFEDENLHEKVLVICKKFNIKIILPCSSQHLEFWSKNAAFFEKNGITVIVSPLDTIQTFDDRWNTYKFCKLKGIPVTRSALKEMEKPDKPVIIKSRKVLDHEIAYMQNLKKVDKDIIYQERIDGTDYSINVLFDFDGKPLCISTLERIATSGGQTIASCTVKDPEIEKWIKKIATLIKFKGPVNFQCIRSDDGDLFFMNIHTRVSTDIALSMNASCNWIVMLDKMIHNEVVAPFEAKEGQALMRHFSEIFMDFTKMNIEDVI